MTYRYSITVVLCIGVSSLTYAAGVSSPAPAKYPGSAIASALLSNLAIFSFNRFIMHADYAMISASSVNKNLHSPWVWDQDEFLVNHIGHPYQGSLYYIAGRANNLNFAGSSLLTAVNSTIWELFFETERPSRNDFIATTMGGIALGEMLHRSAFEISLFNRPVSFLVSPIDGFSLLISPTHTRNETPSSFRSGLTSFATGFVTSEFKNTDDFNSVNVRRAVTINAMADIVYGDIFGVSTLEPFSQFEASLKASLSPSYYSVNLTSDGILAGKSVFTSTHHLSTLGISMNFDFLFSRLIDFSTHAIGISYKHICMLNSAVSLSSKVHANWIVLGANDYPHLRNGAIPEPQDNNERRDYDLGTGESIKLFLSLSTSRFGRCEFGYCGYGIHTIPASIPERGSEGYTLINLGFLIYEYAIKKNLNIGLQGSVYHKHGFYTNASDIDEVINTVSFFIKRRFSRK